MITYAPNNAQRSIIHIEISHVKICRTNIKYYYLYSHIKNKYFFYSCKKNLVPKVVIINKMLKSLLLFLFFKCKVNNKT